MKLQKVLKKGVLALCVVSLMASLFSGCGDKATSTNDSTTSASTTQEKKVEAPKKISIMTISYGENPPADNYIMKTVQELTNTTLNVLWVPSTNYNDKVNVTIASGDLPNAMFISDVKAGAFTGSVKQGAFWEIGSLLKNYPTYLANLDSVRLSNSAIEGKNYGIPRYRALGRTGYVFRKDWLDALGLKTPTTTDELYTMLKAFTLNDPDKNGKNDTLGAVIAKDPFGGTPYAFSVIMAGFGAPNAWYADSSGKIHPDVDAKEYMDGLNFVKKLYDEKLINQDFAVTADSAALLKKGNAGVRFGGVNDDIRSNWSELYQNAPNAKLDAIYKLKGPQGEKTFAAGGGFSGMIVFPKSSNKTEADLKSMLSFYDSLNDPKVVNVMCWGKEGDDYSLVNGKATKSTQQIDSRSRNSYSIMQLTVLPDSSPIKGAIQSAAEADQKCIAMWTENEKNGLISDPTIPFVSDTWTAKGADLNKILNDAKVKYIMGAINEAGFKAEVQKFYQNGGEKVCQEYTDMYAKTKK